MGDYRKMVLKDCMTQHKMVYVASPVRAILERIMYLDDAHREIIETAREAARVVKNAGHIPISPALLWFEVFNDYKDRELLMDYCKFLLAKCAEIYVAKSKYSKFSTGIQKEIEWAREFGLTQVEY
ncbi:MAG: DUF1937 family protein [Campylobacteraceae bacterium]|jgi:hypothetical protein|nr:DUF1937 family protein [Campylobacteraceae bacterium]